MKNIMNTQTFKSFFAKKYPSVTRARKIWVSIIAVVIPAIVLVIIFNLSYSKGFVNEDEAQGNQKHSKVQQLATSDDTEWYKNDSQSSEAKNKLQKSPENLKGLMLGGTNNANNMDDETQKAMRASITTNQITGDNQSNSLNNSSIQNEVHAESDNSSKESQLNPGIQNESQIFLNEAEKNNPDYLSESVQNPMSPYELQAGSIIPATLITGINSDLPGQIIAQVTENVYDSITGNNLLIPQGTKVIGVYDSKIAYGQERVLVAWKRLLFPNGKSLDLDGMPGIDMSGYAGFNDEVDNHYGKIFGSVILMSFLSAGAQLSQPQEANSQYSQPTVNQMLAQSLGTNLANTGNMITQKNVNIQPELEIRQGFQFNISVTKDMFFT